MNPKVDFYFSKAKKWKEEQELLRSIALSAGLTEELKWGVPSYTHEGRNIVLIHAFKEYCAYLFFKGALLKDKEKILVQQTKNVQSARQIRFTSIAEVKKFKPALKAYLKEAIAVDKAGLEVTFKKTAEFEMPDEFRNAMKKSSALKKAFSALTPGRQRGYLLFFAAAKQAKTREERIKKYTPRILTGQGLHD